MNPLKYPFVSFPLLSYLTLRGQMDSILVAKHTGSGFTPEGCVILGDLGSWILSFLIYKMTTNITELFPRAVAAATGGPGMKMASYSVWPLDSISMTTTGALWE